MNKLKRFFALIGALLLSSLYISSLIFALIGNEISIKLLNAAVACTILLPILLYGFLLVYRLSKKNDENNDISDK